MKLVIATQNKHKLLEFQELAKEFNFELLSLADLNLEALQIYENGSSFAENAKIKAEVTQVYCQDAYVLADDSGFCIKELDNRPGIYSARFGGPNASYADKFAKIYQMLEGKQIEAKECEAFFTVVLLYVFPKNLMRKLKYFRQKFMANSFLLLGVMRVLVMILFFTILH